MVRTDERMKQVKKGSVPFVSKKGSVPFVSTAARLTRRAVLLTATALPLAGCWGSTYEWNQKLTLVVQTPQGEVTASSVIHASYTYGQMPMSGNDMSGGYTGEAVVLKFNNGKYLFALLDADRTDEYHRLLLTFATDLPNDRKAGFAAITKLLGAKSLSPTIFPMLVTFGNINDPKSVKQIQPNDLASHFGAGYSLKSITLEVTDEPVTVGGIEAALVWISSLKGGYLHGGFTSKGAPFGLHAGNFLMEQH